MDGLDPASIKGAVEHARNLEEELKGAEPTNLEEEIDRLTLAKSTERFIWHFGRAKSWRRNPTLYVKIPLFAIDEVLARDFQSPDELRQVLAGILFQIPGFLVQGIDNLERSSALSASVAAEMARDAVSLFRDDVVLFIEEKLNADADLLKSTHVAVDGWQSYEKSLRDLSAEPSFCQGERAMTEMFTTGLDYPRSPSEVLAWQRRATDRPWRGF